MFPLPWPGIRLQGPGKRVQPPVRLSRLSLISLPDFLRRPTVFLEGFLVPLTAPTVRDRGRIEACHSGGATPLRCSNGIPSPRLLSRQDPQYPACAIVAIEQPVPTRNSRNSVLMCSSQRFTRNSTSSDDLHARCRPCRAAAASPAGGRSCGCSRAAAGRSCGTAPRTARSRPPAPRACRGSVIASVVAPQVIPKSRVFESGRDDPAVEQVAEEPVSVAEELVEERLDRRQTQDVLALHHLPRGHPPPPVDVIRTARGWPGPGSLMS